MATTKFISERNLRFLLYEVFDLESLTDYPYYQEYNRKMFDMVLDAAVKLSKDLMWPILEEMDAKQRSQGRNLSQKDPALAAVAIIEHADVKRMLLFQRSVVEGALALLLQSAKYADLERVSTGGEKEKYALLLDILTPVVKSYPSEMGILSVSQGLQCLGGYGYCEDFPLEQYYRDARIHPIHEGTTGIQGMDLLGRKVIMQDGRAYGLYLEEIQHTIEKASGIDQLTSYTRKLEKACELLQSVTTHMKSLASSAGPEVFLADATVYLEFFSIIAVAWQWLKQMVSIQKGLEKKPSRSETQFYNGKFHAFRFFFLL